MKKYLIGTTLALALVLAGSPATVSAESNITTTTTTTGSSSMLELIQSLIKQVEELQKQLSAMRGEIRDLRSGLREGVENDDVRKVQELLATDPTIYPKGSVTGYFGPLTKEAIMAFQKRHGLPETGEVDEATKTLLQDYLKKKTDKTIAPGWIKAPGLDKKIEDKKWVDTKTGTTVKDPNAIIGHSEGMIKAATSVIAQLEEGVEEAEDDEVDADDIKDAEEDLVRAKAELASAEDYYDDKEYQKAYDMAYKAKMSAYAGIEELK